MRKFFFLFFTTLIFYSFNSSISYAQGKKDVIITLSCQYGDISLLLYDKTKKHKDNFIKLSKEGFYNGTTFHRVIKDFMIQGGDPYTKDSIAENDGQGGPGYNIPSEIFPDLTHRFGAVAAARLGDNVNPLKESSGSQFYIVQNHAGTPHLNNQYTVFGQVIKGLEVIDKIAEVKKNTNDRPLEAIKITVTNRSMNRRKIIRKYKAEEFYNK